MKIRGYEFSRGPSGGLDIVVRQSNADNALVISSLGLSEVELYELLAVLGLSAEGEDDLAEELEEMVFDDEDELKENDNGD